MSTKEITAALCKFIQEVGTIEEKSDAQYDKFADLLRQIINTHDCHKGKP